MYLKQIKKNGITRLYFYESYYDATSRRVKQKCIQSLGRLDQLKNTIPDPIAHFTEMAHLQNQAKEEAAKTQIVIDMNQSMDDNEDNLKNVGYGIFKELYRQLDLSLFWKRVKSKENFEYNIDEIFRMLTISRILFPASKKKTYEQRSVFFEQIDGFSLDDVYHALDIIDRYHEDLQEWIFKHSDNICARDMSVSYFDCTNYYFDIGRSDLDQYDMDGNPVDDKGNPTEAKYRKRGPEKNHRPDPIVELGLLMDKNGIPLAYDLFPGNESEKVHMRPVITRVKHQFSNTRIIVVADRGLNTSDNIYYINGTNKTDNNMQDGYVYGQSVRGADEEFKNWILKNEGYRTDEIIDIESGNTIYFKHKSRIYPKKIEVNVTVPGSKKKKKKSVSIDQKQMVYYSEKYALKQKNDRNMMIERAKDLIAHPKKYDRITASGSAAYISNISFDKTTGEIVEGKELLLNMEKIKEEEKYDGYYSIVTSELNMDDIEMRKIYRGLARIEETFKISKSDINSRPVFVRTNPHIDGHFAICFTALVMIRLLQTKLGQNYPVARIIESLRKYNCVQISQTIWQFIYYDDVIKECGKQFNMDLNNKYRKQIEIRRLLRY